MVWGCIKKVGKEVAMLETHRAWWNNRTGFTPSPGSCDRGLGWLQTCREVCDFKKANSSGEVMFLYARGSSAM